MQAPPPPQPPPHPAPPPDASPPRADPARITPGLIFSLLPHSRAANVANLLRSSITRLAEHADQGAASKAVLSMLNIEELRRLARELGVNDAGDFNALHERLAALC